MSRITRPFIGAEAVNDGLVRKHQLRSGFCAIYPGVYLPAGIEPTFAHRVEAAWLWSRRKGVIGGLTAARLFGAKWISDDLPVELVWPNARPPKGICTTDMALGEGETVLLGGGLPVTSLERTAFDLARRRPLKTAVARLDALAAGKCFDASLVENLMVRHRGVRGARQVEKALALHDPGAQSPKESWLRLLVLEAGFPRPRTQIPVAGRAGRRYYLDMGWEDLKVAIEYDGDHHRTDRSQFAKDIVRLEELAELGWIVIRVAADTPAAEVIWRLRRAWEARTSSTLR
jgi:very-short-patch-repair endonuclease